MKTSMAWLQDSRAICFQPDDLFAALYLGDCEMSEMQLRVAVRRVNHEQELLQTISRVPDKRARAEELAPFVLSEFRAAQSFAFEQLEACGQAAVPTLLGILHDPATLDKDGDAIKVLVAVEGQQAGPELTALLDSDVSFWTAIRPTLKPDWWYQNNDATPLRYLPRRYSRTIDLIRALDGLRYSGARNTVIALRDVWRSLPPMNVPKGNSGMSRGDDQMIDECTSLLNRLANN